MTLGRYRVTKTKHSEEREVMERLVREKVCDRCGREFDVKEVKGGMMEAPEKQRPVFTAALALDGKDVQNVEFVDLCKKCEGRIGSLMSSIRMDKKEESSK